MYFTVNTASGTISRYSIRDSGALTLPGGTPARRPDNPGAPAPAGTGQPP
jgi:hypothetical protein